MLALKALLLAFLSATTAEEIPPNSAGIKFPIVVTSAQQLKEFGLSVTCCGVNYPSLLHLCYDVGPGADVISVSHERLHRYREIGFTLQSLCFGLLSESLFDPETGKRLPTYIAIDFDKIKKINQGREQYVRNNPFLNYDVSMTAEHPLELPQCYRRALPYTDCVFNFDRLTGARLGDIERHNFKRLGEALDAAMVTAVRQRLACTWPYCPKRYTRHFDYSKQVGGLVTHGEHGCFDQPPVYGYLSSFTENVLAPHGIDVPPSLLEIGRLSCFDVSIDLPGGYGYTTDADSTAGPSVSPELLKIAADGSRHVDQLDPVALKAAIAGQSNPNEAPKDSTSR
jgi:hypothetical protein